MRWRPEKGCFNRHPNRIKAITRHGKSKTREYQKYSQAKQRCENPNCKRYQNYGGRGIEFRFKSFEEFFTELGLCPDNRTLDRINNDGHYEVGNVRWATKEQQYESRRPWRKRCPHDLPQSECKICSTSLCPHRRRKNRCKECKLGEPQ